MSIVITDSDLITVVEAYRAAGNNAAEGARRINMPVSTFKHQYGLAIRRNLTGDFQGGPLPKGYHMGRVTSLVGPDGTMMEWQHKSPDVRSPEEIAAIVAEALANVPKVVATDYPDTHYRHDSLAMFPVVDLHLMMLCWGQETGENYDTEIASELFKRTFLDIVNSTPACAEALLINLGDYFHADNNNAQTEKSGNHLDVDSRVDRAIFAGAELQAWAIDTLLQKFPVVRVRNQRGNHDPNLFRTLTMGMWMRYLNEPRVIVERSPVEYWFFQWGQTMLAFHHGDLAKGEQMPGIMAAYAPKIWGATEFRYAFLGHIHHSKKSPPSDEKNGATYEYLPTLAAKDGWNKAMGHASKRSMSAIVFSQTGGAELTITRNIKGA